VKRSVPGIVGVTIEMIINTNEIKKVTSPPPLPCGVVEFTPQGKPSPLEGEGVKKL
jgi:hypothetical protein